MATREPLHIMLVEDDDNDVRITQRALKKGRLDNKISIARDGQEALDYLNHRPPFDDIEQFPDPGLILLDINLPKINGIDVLRAIKGDIRLRRIPVLMLTTSTRREDVAAAYAHGANGFICKPIEFARFVRAITDLNEYWTTLAQIPG